MKCLLAVCSSHTFVQTDLRIETLRVHRTLCCSHFSHAHSLSSSVVRLSSITHIPCICMAQDEAVRIFQNSSYLAQHVLRYT